ncbi:hypothetical protein LC607_19100 [Nostoc sp. CHAB 5824]|nr:hypothetical protein [Nostoc sp. CHAB 5824]
MQISLPVCTSHSLIFGDVAKRSPKNSCPGFHAIYQVRSFTEIYFGTR